MENMGADYQQNEKLDNYEDIGLDDDEQIEELDAEQRAQVDR